MDLYPVFQDRAWRAKATGRLALTVDRLLWTTRGGPQEAEITARSADPADLWELLEWLRYPVWVRDTAGRNAWWGHVSEVRVRVGKIEIGVRLASLYNAVRVTYSSVAPGTTTVGKRKTTAWATNADSIREYGRKEMLSSQSGLSDAVAATRRAALLTAYQWPGGSADVAAGGELSATLICSGWFDTLSWRYASWAMVSAISYLATTGTEQAFGNAAATTMVMQQIRVGAQSLNALQLSIRARKVGAPVDNLTVGLYAVDGAGNPTGSPLASFSIAGTALTTSLATYRMALNQQAQLAANKLYAVRVSRSGAVNGTNYFAVEVNQALPNTGGVFRIWNNTTWVARAPDADLLLAVWVDNNVESTAQIADLIAIYGQFLTGSSCPAGLGELLPSYRDGDTTALDEVVALLEHGSKYDRRLLATVDADRQVWIDQEPARGTPGCLMTGQGELLDASGAPWVPYLSPVGRWCRLKDVIGANVDLSRLDNPTLQFIEEATYTPADGIQVRFRGQLTPEDLFKVK